MNFNKKLIPVAVATALLIGCTTPVHKGGSIAEKSPQKKRPNFVTIVIDDMGFSDLGAFGGEVPTPNLDQLAADGIMLTNFYAAATSSPSRSMLFSGRDNHEVGMGSMGAEADMPLDDPIFPEIISGDGGYYTMMVGKWHLGESPDHYPHARGFEKSMILLEGGDTQYLSDANGKNKSSFPPEKIAALGRETYYNANGLELKKFPANAYSTDYYTDVGIKMLDKWDGERPFYLHMSHIAVHSPWQAPRDITAKYINTYAKGWDVLHEERFNKQKVLGLVPADAKLPSRPEEARAWDSLNAEEQKLEAKRMAVYGAMIDVLDTNVGKLIQHLKNKGMYENTVFFVYSDNGAAGTVSHVSEPGDPDTDYIIDNFVTDFPGDNSNIYEKMGDKDTFPTADTKEWGWLSNTPFRGLKSSTYEGGVHTMGFLHYSKSSVKGVKEDCIISVRDISTTILEMGELEYPTNFKGKALKKPMNNSMMGLFDNTYKCKEDVPLGFGVIIGPVEAEGLRAGDWKLSQNKVKIGTGKMSLFNLKEDPFEQNDLSVKNPEKYREMTALFQEYLNSTGQTSK